MAPAEPAADRATPSSARERVQAEVEAEVEAEADGERQPETAEEQPQARQLEDEAEPTSEPKDSEISGEQEPQPARALPRELEEQEEQKQETQEEHESARPATTGAPSARSPPPRASFSAPLPKSNKPFVPLTPRSWRVRVMHSNTRVTRLVKAALLQTLLHAVRVGSVEGVKVAIERGVQVHYIDSRQRNLLMLASRCDTDARLEIAIILADAGCDINHADQLGWSCLHYACASGALDVATELIRRGARIEFNPYGYGPEDFIIPKVSRAKSLLQHTEQLQHEQNVRECWEFFRKNAEKSGYGVKCKSHADLGKPLKVTFQAPTIHSPLDRIRVVDINSDVALWLQVSKTFSIPPGEVGTITLDSETLDRPSLYRIFYEKYEPTPVQIPPEVAEKSLCVKNLDTGTTVSVGSVNDLVLKQLRSTRTAKKASNLSQSSREAPKSEKADTGARRLASTGRSGERKESSREGSDEEEVAEDEDSGEFSSDETITNADIADHPAINSITGVYKTAAMSTVSVSTLKSAKANEYQIVIKRDGPIGLHLEPRADPASGKKKKKLMRSTQLIVRRSQGQSAAVNPGDCLVAIGNANIEHAGLKHTLWELNEARRPLVLRFRRGNAKEKKSLFAAGLSKLSGPRRQAAIAV